MCIDGITASDCRVEAVLAPGETFDHCATLHLPSPFQDDVLAIQRFVVTDRLDLVFASQNGSAPVSLAFRVWRDSPQ